MKKEKVWIKNFSGHHAGYHILTPFFDFVVENSQKILFGEEVPLYLTEYFGVMEGVDLEGAYFIEEEMQRLIQNIIEVILKEPDRIEKLHQENYQTADDYFQFCKKIFASDLTKLSKKELGKLYVEMIQWQEKPHQHTLTTTWFLDSEGEQFSKLLIKKTKELVLKSGKDIDFAEAFSLLTTLPRNSIGLEEEIESLKVLKKISESAEAEKIFLGLKDFSKIPEDLDEEIKKAIIKHFEKWCWIPFGFMGPAYKIDYYLSVWSGLLKEKVRVDEEIKKLVNRPKNVEKERKQLMEELNLDKKTKQLYDIAADIAFLKGYRKEVWFFGCYVLDYLLKEIAKRLYFSLNQIHLISYEELKEVLIKDKEVDLAEINERGKFAVIYHRFGEPLQIWTGKKAKDFLSQQNIKKEEIDVSVTEFQGTCACSGKAKGRVKIVNSAEEIHKMEEGDIMVSHTTYPSLVPAMKKAAAIITEDGGITCHAAIVSRELGTPCVTGIKTATSVLKDGDEVEVDAGEGIVRKIKGGK